MGRLGPKRRLQLEHEYRRLVSAGTGTVHADQLPATKWPSPKRLARNANTSG
jgi:hypothetical protein